MIEKGVSPTTYTFNSSATETNGYIPAETKGNLLGNGLNNTCPSSQSLGKGGGARGPCGGHLDFVFKSCVVCILMDFFFAVVVAFIFS